MIPLWEKVGQKKGFHFIPDRPTGIFFAQSARNLSFPWLKEAISAGKTFGIISNVFQNILEIVPKTFGISKTIGQ